MVRKAQAAALLSVALGVALSSAPAAHADVKGYLNYLASHHINTALNTPKTNIYYGLRVCDLLREGVTPTQITQQAVSPADMPGIIEAAQHELCPDTLH
jgi:hypothetical protein